MSERTIPVVVRFTPTLDDLARAMALEARDKIAESSLGRHELGAETYVRSMKKADAMHALRAALWAYGQLSWPEDVPVAAYRAARDRVASWWA